MKPKINCYSGGEGSFMAWWQHGRAVVLAPFLRRLARLGLPADHITLSSLLVGLAFVPLWLAGHPALAVAALAVHALLDGLDGPLARYLRQASDRGSFTDTMADQLVVTTTALTLIHTGYLAAWPGGLYVFFYAVVVGFALVRNALSAPYSWLLRPRFIVYTWLLVETFLWPGTLTTVVYAVTAVLALKAVTGFLTIRGRM